jgi:hypothetical protein
LLVPELIAAPLSDEPLCVRCVAHHTTVQRVEDLGGTDSQLR